MAADPEELRKEILREQIRQAQQQMQEVDTSPLEPIPPRRMVTDPRDRFFQPQTEQGQRVGQMLDTSQENISRAQGVETRQPASANVQFRQSFADDPAGALDVLSENLKRAYGQDIPVRISPNTGRPEFLNPETNRFTDVEGIGIQGEDFAAVGSAIPVAGAAAGGIIGGLGGKGIPGIIVGEGIGGATGEGIRRGIGEYMGVNPASTEENISASLRRGAEDAAFAAGFGGIARAISRFTRAGVGPRVLTEEQAQKLLNESASADEVVEKLRERGYEVDPTVVQRSGLKEALDQEATLAARREDFSQASRTRAQRNSEELTRFADEELGLGRGVGDEEAAKRGLERAVAGRDEARLQPRRERLETLEDAVKRESELLPGLDEPFIGQAVRGDDVSGLLGAREAGKRQEDRVFDLARRIVGGDEVDGFRRVEIPQTPEFRASVQNIGEEAQRALFESQAAGKEALIARLQGDGPITLQQIQDSLSFLRRQRRISDRGMSSTDPAVRDIAQLERSLTKMRDDYLSQTEPMGLSAIKYGEDLVRQNRTFFDRRIGKLLTKKDGEFLLDDTELARQVLDPRNVSRARNVRDALRNDLEATQTVRNGILGRYRDEVIENGVPDPKLHNKFMEKNKELLEVWFNPSEMRQVQRLGRFSRVVAEQRRRLDLLENALQKEGLGKFARGVNAESLAEGLLSTARGEGKTSVSRSQVRNMVTLLDAGSPQTLDLVRQNVADEIRRKTVKDGSLDLASFEKILKDMGDLDGNKNVVGKLGMLYGPSWSRDARLTLEALRIQSRQGQALPSPAPADTVIGLARRFLSPRLAPAASPQRGVSVGLGNMVTGLKAAEQRALHEALSDPAKLRAYRAALQRDINLEQLATITQGLGAPEIVPLIQEYNRLTEESVPANTGGGGW